MPASACANVVQSAAARVVHPQAGVFASSKNETQQLYVVGQEVKVPPVPCAHAQVMFAVSSSQLQVVPPLVPAVPVPPLVPAVPDVC